MQWESWWKRLRTSPGFPAANMSNSPWFTELAAERVQNEYDFLRNQAQLGTLHRLDQSDCVSTFAMNFVQKVSAVVLVTKDSVEWCDIDLTSFTPLEASQRDIEPYAWMCNYDTPCDRSQDASHGIWDVCGHTVDFCLVASADEKCTIELK